MLLKVFRRHVDGYTHSHPQLHVGARTFPHPVSSSSHSAAAAVAPRGAVAAGAVEEHSLVEAEQFVNIIMQQQQQHMSQSAAAAASGSVCEEEEEESVKGADMPRSISMASLQQPSQLRFQQLRSPPAELKQHFDEYVLSCPHCYAFILLLISDPTISSSSSHHLTCIPVLTESFHSWRTCGAASWRCMRPLRGNYIYITIHSSIYPCMHTYYSVTELP